MATLFVFLFLASLVVLVVGLIKPSWVIKWGQKRGRKQVGLYYSISTIVFFFLIAAFAPPVEKTNIKADKSVENASITTSTSTTTPNTSTSTIDSVVSSSDPNLSSPLNEVTNSNQTAAQASVVSPTVSPAANQPVKTSDTPQLFKVTKVVDGDTIEISTGERVRYIGMDTPETVDPRKSVQCFGKEASNKNKELVEGKEVRLVKDISDKDKYGRLLRYVYVGDTFINLELVKQGYASSYSYPPDIKYQSQILQAQKDAQVAKLGLWSACDGTQAVATTTVVVPQATTQTQGSNGCDIKGNISSGGKIYHLPGCGSYDKTVIDESAGEKWFCTEAEAVAAGWRKALNCP